MYDSGYTNRRRLNTKTNGTKLRRLQNRIAVRYENDNFLNAKYNTKIILLNRTLQNQKTTISELRNSYNKYYYGPYLLNNNIVLVGVAAMVRLALLIWKYNIKLEIFNISNYNCLLSYNCLLRTWR